MRAELRRLQKEVRERFSPEDFREGDWFLQNLQDFVRRYHGAERLRAFEKMHPHLDARELANLLIEDTARNATLAGGASGVALSAVELTSFLTWGVSLTLGAATALAEMLYQVNLQLQLTFDLAALNSLVVSVDEPEQMILIFATGAGLNQLDLHADGDRTEVAMLTQGVFKHQIAKLVARQIGIRLVKWTASKLLLPVLNVGISSYASRSMAFSVGKAAGERFGKIRRLKEQIFELRPRITTQQQEILLVALGFFQADGLLTLEEVCLLQELARSLQASSIWQRIVMGDIEFDSEQFVLAFRDPRRFVDRELLLRILQILGEAKLQPNVREADFLRRLLLE